MPDDLSEIEEEFYESLKQRTGIDPRNGMSPDERVEYHREKAIKTAVRRSFIRQWLFTALIWVVAIIVYLILSSIKS